MRRLGFFCPRVFSIKSNTLDNCPVFINRNAMIILPTNNAPAMLTVQLITFECAKYLSVAKSRIANSAAPSNSRS